MLCTRNGLLNRALRKLRIDSHGLSKGMVAPSCLRNLHSFPQITQMAQMDQISLQGPRGRRIVLQTNDPSRSDTKSALRR
jgi:hypothetical protein